VVPILQIFTCVENMHNCRNAMYCILRRLRNIDLARKKVFHIGDTISLVDDSYPLRDALQM